MSKKIIILSGLMLSLVHFFCTKQKAVDLNIAETNSLSASESKNKNQFGESNFFDPTGLIAEHAELKLLGSGYGFTEGPAVDKHGNVFFTDQPNNQIHKWAAHNRLISPFVTSSGRSNGTYFDKNGYLITCADMHGEIWSIDKNGNHTVLINNYGGKLLNGPNDLWVNPKNGGIYVTDPLYQRGFWDATDPRLITSQQGGGFVYYLSPNRKSFNRVAGMDFDQSDLNGNNRILPNGIVGTPDGRKLYVGHIWPEKTYVYDIKPNGTLSNKQVFVNKRTDGMTMDERGNIYLTNEDGVTAYNKNGKRILNVPTGEGWTANVVFGGENGKTLFITALGKVFGLKMKVKGVVK
jgi:gluconolactonase